MKNSPAILVAVALLLVVVCALLLIMRERANREMRQEAIAAHHAAVTNCQELGRKMNERIQAARKAGISRAEFTRQFGELSTCSREAEPDSRPHATHTYTHEPSHRVFYLRFDGDSLMGVRSTHGPDDIQPHLPSIEQTIAEME